MTDIQQNLLEYIDDAEDSEDKFQNIIDIIRKNIIENNREELKPFLYLLAKISNNHHRTANFFSKIDRILESLKDDLQKFYSNSELFNIFSRNKRILLILIEMKILKIDESIVRRIIQRKYLESKYPQYFQPEIQPFINKSWFPKYKNEWRDGWILEISKEIPEYFYKRRKIAENDHFICELIRKDSLDDFIVYMNKTNYQFNFSINPSIFETNNFLLKKEKEKKNPTIIEYSAFFGSIQIFNYLINNKKVELTPSLWYYGIHGNNAEIIQILEDEKIKPPEEKSYEDIKKESMKCHHNEISDYIQDNYLVNEKPNFEVVCAIKYRNFKFIKNEKINETIFNYLCKYDYYTLVSQLLSQSNIDINCKDILIQNSFILFKYKIFFFYEISISNHFWD